MYYPDGVVTDQPDTFLAAELLREKLLAMAREELPHSLAVTVEEIEERPADGGKDALLVLRAVVRVERDSQKAIVIGKGGCGHQGGGHGGPDGAGSPPRDEGPPGDPRQGGEGLAAASRRPRPPRILRADWKGIVSRVFPSCRGRPR